MEVRAAREVLKSTGGAAAAVKPEFRLTVAWAKTWETVRRVYTGATVQEAWQALMAERRGAEEGGVGFLKAGSAATMDVDGHGTASAGSAASDDSPSAESEDSEERDLRRELSSTNRLYFARTGALEKSILQVRQRAGLLYSPRFLLDRPYADAPPPSLCLAHPHSRA